MESLEKPIHAGIILDGNRRWARENGKSSSEGHSAGFERLKEAFKWARELGVKELSLYCFSIQNFERDKSEVSYLMKLFEKSAEEMLASKDVHENKIRVRFIGRLGMLPAKTRENAEKLMEATKEYSNYTINFCTAYGGREEIVDGVNRAIADAKAGKIENVSEAGFAKYLYINSEPDLIIRTSGEKRLSNFLLWHSSYSELFFMDKHWPDFSKADFERIIKEFRNARERRFGR